ncbi:MAG: chromosome segregation protein SMC, partial [Clostridiales bacterium]|nr:chromosome segregation protein SMC [Clostridiales bacterium]
LSQAEEILFSLIYILTGLEERVGPLKKQSEKAQKFLVLASEKKELEIGLWLDILDRSSELIREQSNKYTVASVHYNETENELNEIIKSSEDAAEAIREINIKIDELRRCKSELEEEASSSDSLVAVNKNSIEHNNESIQRFESEISQESLSSSQIDEQIAQSEKSISEKQAFIDKKNSETDSLAGEINSLKERDSGVSEDYVKLADKISFLTKNLSSEQIKSTSAGSSIEEIQKRKISVSGEAENKKIEISDLKTEIIRIEAEIKMLDEKISAFTNAVSGYMIKVSSKAVKVEQHKFSTDKAELDLIQKQNRVNMLLEMEKNMEGYQGSVKSVIKAASNGVLKGIRGTVSQIINAPDEYSLAIETALGAAIQNIVTENEDSAKKAMYHLKNSNAGRATFLPMTAVRGRTLEESGLENCSGYISAASDIVKFDRQYENIVKSLLGRTVIAENIDDAIAIAKKYSNRFKIVTLDGQVINAGGSMTGGSQIRHSGFLSRSNEIARLKDEIKADSEKLEEMKREDKKLKEDYNADNAALEGVKGDLLRTQEDKIKAESNLSLERGRLKIAQDALKALSDESLSSEERITQLEQIRDEAENNAKAAEIQIEECQKQLDSLAENRREFAEEREKINGRISDINVEIVSAVRDIENLKSHISELTERKNSQSGRIERLNGEIQAAKEKNVRLKLRIDELNGRSDEIRSQIEKYEGDIQDLAQKRNLSEKQSGELRTAERQKNEEKERLSAELVRIEEKKNSLLKEQEDTQTKLFEEYKLSRREAQELNIKIDSVSDAKKRLGEVRNKIKSLGNVNVGAVEEYKEVSERYEFMREQVDDVEKSKDELNKLIYSLTDKMAVQFRERFEEINKNFTQTFTELFGGGKAELILEDESNILECGIEIKAQPPGKNVKSMTLLSGGEKGLCAIALLLAILKVTPSPFCIFDEVEAALDDVNVLRYARYLKGMTDKIQFILITHRRGTMEEADMLYGVTMQEHGVSKLLQLKTAQMAEDLGLE